VTQEGSLFQGGSGTDSIFAYTGTVSGSTVQGLDGNDLINLGNQTDTIDISIGVSGKNVSAGNGSAGVLTLNYSGNYVSSNVIANASVSTGTSVSAGTAGVSLTVTELVTTGIASLQYATVNGNAGNDTVALGDQLSAVAGSLIAGGAGNDLVGSYNWASGAATTGVSTAGQIQDAFTGSTVNGGDGNDTVYIAYSGGDSARNNTLNGNAGNDSVSFSSTSAAFYSGLIGGGKGDDTIFATFRSGVGWTINGGAGADSVEFAGLSNPGTGLIQGDTTSAQAGSDTIKVTFSGATSITVNGMAGNDSIYVSSTTAGGSILLAGGDGEDTIYFNTAAMKASNLSAWTINGGAGNDSIVLTAQSAGVAKSSVFNGGAGDDTITIGGAANALCGSAGSDGSTVNGGAGTDLITMSAVGTASGRATFEYGAFSDSTLSNTDTITFNTAVISAASNSGFGDTRMRFSFTPGGLSLATGSGRNQAGNGLSATGGYIVFSGFTDTDVTARVSAIDATYTTTGTVAVFTTDGSERYLFVQGGATDSVIKLSDSDGLSAGNTIIYTDGSTAIGF